MRRPTTLLALAAAVGAAAVPCGCATTALSARGSKIVAVASAPGAGCESLGAVIGHWYGQSLMAGEGSESALNDALNKAADRGATHVVPSPPQLAADAGGWTTATVMAIAYRCPSSPVAPVGAAPATPKQ
jgi:hypothetical protein